ncbi:HET domain-containing protein [Candidatus Bathyarchaeota archaeon]|nr:HET domain-containing protein [Candidatus Bathyarchaeota archaeon]
MREQCIDEYRGSYEALSYVWGDQTKMTPIQVGDCTLEVTKNLRAALRDLRKPDRPRTLWADALCIDQSSVPEKNSQVGVMDEIYRSASKTVIWTGSGVEDETEEAYVMLEELAAEATSREHTTNAASLLSGNLTLFMLDKKLVESELYERFQNDETINHVAEAAWWTRAWTLQEILLAPQAVIVTGSQSMDWQRFCTGVDYGFAIGIWQPMILGMIINPFVPPYYSMRALWQTRKHPSNALSTRASDMTMPTSNALSTLASDMTMPTPAVLEMLVHCRFRHATDPRDKVYALLSLDVADHNHTPLGLKADYATPTSVVYSNAARQLVLRFNNLDLFGACIPSSMEGLPSWAPDWSITSPAPRSLMYDAFGRLRQTHASARTHPSARFLDDGHTLILSGHEVTTIETLAPVLHRLQLDLGIFDELDDTPIMKPPGKGHDSLFLRLAKLGHALGQVFSGLASVYASLTAVVPQIGTYSDWEALARSSAPRNPYPKVDGAAYDPLAVYWRTLCAGAQAPGGADETARMFYAWRANLRPITRLHEWHVDGVLRPIAFLGYLRRTWRGYSEFAPLIEMGYERRLGRGVNGFLALLPAATEVGDKIILVKGGRVPLVLRGDGSGQGYRLVGEAYVEGLMDGEAFDEEACVEMRIR